MPNIIGPYYAEQECLTILLGHHAIESSNPVQQTYR